MNIQTIKPEFGVNYDVGYIGFTMTRGDDISEGIAYFERFERMSDIAVSHAFVVTGDDELVEAHIEHGVQRDCISKYFDDPNVLVFFRKPRNWTPGMGRVIANAAISKIGRPYASGLIVADVLADTLFGRLANKVFKQWPDRFVRALLDEPNRFICSELAAYALSQDYLLYKIGVLKNPLDAIDPQELFEDEIIFDDWAREVSGSKFQVQSPEVGK